MCLIVFDLKVFQSFFFSNVSLTIYLSKKTQVINDSILYGDIKFIYE